VLAACRWATKSSIRASAFAVSSSGRRSAFEVRGDADRRFGDRPRLAGSARGEAEEITGIHTEPTADLPERGDVWHPASIRISGDAVMPISFATSRSLRAMRFFRTTTPRTESAIFGIITTFKKHKLIGRLEEEPGAERT
jgi:hypothetical protein